MTSINIHDPADAGAPLPELPPLPIGALVVGAQNLLQEAADLPQPHYITIHDTTQSIGCQFTPEPASIRAVTRWALRFGGVVLSEPIQVEDGLWTYCRTQFGYYGVDVLAYTHIPAAPATPTLRSGDPDERP